MNISSNLQHIGASFTTALNNISPNQATMDKAYNVALVALKAVATIAVAFVTASIGYTALQEGKGNEAFAAAVTAIFFAAIFLATPSSEVPAHERCDENHFKDYADREKEATIRDAEIQRDAASAARTASASITFHAGKPHVPVGTRS